MTAERVTPTEELLHSRVVGAANTILSREAFAEMVAGMIPQRATELTTSYETFTAVNSELNALVWQLAEMAQHEPHQLVATCDYIHGLLEREPLRSQPMWEPQRVVLGLFVMALAAALAHLELITAEEQAALRPAWNIAAGEAVRDTFDAVYIPPDDTEEEPLPSEADAAPIDEPDDPTRFL